MSFPAWRKRLASLLTTAEREWGRSAKAVVGVTIAVAGLPPGDMAGTSSIQPEESLASTQPSLKRLIHGFVLSRGPNKSVNTGKPGTPNATNPAATTPAATAAPP